jgi:hypothetical protein
MGAYPVSEICPDCGAVDFRKVYPEGKVAFTYDRVCKRCRTRYTPPTPAWASLLFILIGGVFVAIGSVGIAFPFFAKMSSDSQGVGPFLGGISVAVFGLGIGGYGIRCLVRGGR